MKQEFAKVLSGIKGNTQRLKNTLHSNAGTIKQQVNDRSNAAYKQTKAGIEKELQGYLDAVIKGSTTVVKTGAVVSTGVTFATTAQKHMKDPTKKVDVIGEMKELSKKALDGILEDIKKSQLKVGDSLRSDRIVGKELPKLGPYGRTLASAGSVLLPPVDENSEKKLRPIHAAMTAVNEVPPIVASVVEEAGVVVGTTLANIIVPPLL